jgi:dephospho-CoA kinase
MLVIGLTGGIGAGKTEVSKILRELGAAVINADLLGHEVYKPQTEGWREVVQQFGEGVLTAGGEVDRKKLGAIVFNDSGALKRLNAITHPRIYAMIEKEIRKLGEEGQEVAVVEAALLIEAGWKPLVSQVWVVTTPEEQALMRLRGRSNLSEDAARARIRSQMPQAERVKHADVVIDNSGSLAELRDQVKRAWNSQVLAHKEKSR